MAQRSNSALATSTKAQCPFCSKMFSLCGRGIANHIWQSPYCWQKKKRVLRSLMVGLTSIHNLSCDTSGPETQMRLACMKVLLALWWPILKTHSWLQVVLLMVQPQILPWDAGIGLVKIIRLLALSSLIASRHCGNVFRTRRRQEGLMPHGAQKRNGDLFIGWAWLNCHEQTSIHSLNCHGFVKLSYWWHKLAKELIYPV